LITAVQPEKLLKELEHLWANLGHDQPADALLRACSMTLLVATTDPTDDAELKNTLAGLMRAHPGRMIILRILNSPAPLLEASVTAQCLLAFGGRQQLCCEIIEIRSTPDRLADVYAASLGLTVADLPVLLWLKDIRLLNEPAFQPLLQLARTLLVDSVPLGAAILPTLNDRRRAGWRLKDLAWTRCTAWRETLAQAFESTCLQGQIPQITRVDIAFAGATPSVSALYLRAWLAARLPQAAFHFVPAPPRRHGNLQALRFHAATQNPASYALELRAEDDATLEIVTNTLTTRVLAPARSEVDLLEEELSILGDDLIYEATLAATVTPVPTAE
jgi:glucose-6-phosphate dehydrogenase assembly protein OpcA